jgi:hypothetical protein
LLVFALIKCGKGVELVPEPPPASNFGAGPKVAAATADAWSKGKKKRQEGRKVTMPEEEARGGKCGRSMNMAV